MPAPATTFEFLEIVRKSALVSDDQLTTIWPDLSASDHTVEQISSLLVRAGLITRFQAKQLRAGRYKRFDIAGKYRLLELIGVGGMGAVYLCQHMFMKRLVALKVLPIEKLKDPSALLRFYREARAVAALDHPNIVRAHDIDKVDQLHFLVMEYVDGTSMQDIVARHGPIEPDRAAHYIAQAALGLQHAHALGMVHRDIKPGNLLLDRSGVVKILDMGLARFFDQKHDNVTERFDNNCVLGTADYLAPEQALSSVVDIRADIYALGGSFYYLLTGQAPFPDGTIAQKLVAHQKEDYKPVSEFRSDVSPRILEILDRMLKKDPADRQQSPAELIAELNEWLLLEIPLPPEREMPELCPAVLDLLGKAQERTRLQRADRGTVPGSGDWRSDRKVTEYSSDSGISSVSSPSNRITQAHVQTATSGTTSPISRDKKADSQVRHIEHSESTVDMQAGNSSRLLFPSHPILNRESRKIILVGVVIGILVTLSLGLMAGLVWYLAFSGN